MKVVLALTVIRLSASRKTDNRSVDPLNRWPWRGTHARGVGSVAAFRKEAANDARHAVFSMRTAEVRKAPRLTKRVLINSPCIRKKSRSAVGIVRRTKLCIRYARGAW